MEDKQTAVTVVPIGAIPDHLLVGLTARLSEMLARQCHVAAPIASPASVHDRHGGQYMASAILAVLAWAHVQNAECGLGVIETDVKLAEFCPRCQRRLMKLRSGRSPLRETFGVSQTPKVFAFVRMARCAIIPQWDPQDPKLRSTGSHRRQGER